MVIAKSYSTVFGKSLSDSVTFTITPATVTTGKITAMRIQDMSRQIWFNWNDPARTWDVVPSVVPGTNNLYVALYATNTGAGGSGNMTLTLKTASGNTLATKTEYVAVGASFGLEYTGNMPNSSLSLSASVTP
jgi:hypothetical protein